MKKIPLLIFLASIFVFVIGCDSGGGGNSDNNNSGPATSFQLQEDGSYSPGYRAAFSMTGSDNAGGEYEGSFYIQTKSEIILDNQTVIPVESLFRLENTVRDMSVNASATIYYDEDYKPIVMENSENVRFTPTDINPLPKTAQIGDFGKLTSWSNTEGETQTGSWVLEEGPGGKANLVEMTTYSDYSGSLIVYTETTSTINTDGFVSAVKIKFQYPDGSVINLSGNRV